MKIIVGEIEQTERAFVSKCLKNGDIFFDIGANYGLFTLEGAHAVGPNGKVVSFEPSSREATLLRRNIQQNHLANVVQVEEALSDAPGTARFAIATDGGLNSLASNLHQEQVIQRWDEVKVSTLDAWLSANTHLKSVRMIKMDVEGAECKVIYGAKEFLSSHCPILLCEFNDSTLAGFGNTGQDLYASISSLGYHIFEFKADGKLIHSAPRDYYDSVNLIAIKKESDLVEFATGHPEA